MLTPIEMNASYELVDNDWIHEADEDTFLESLESPESVNEEMTMDSVEYYDRDAWVGNRDVIFDFNA